MQENRHTTRVSCKNKASLGASTHPTRVDETNLLANLIFYIYYALSGLCLSKLYVYSINKTVELHARTGVWNEMIIQGKT